MKNIIQIGGVVLVLLVSGSPLWAQKASTYAALNTFLQSSFFSEFQSMKDKAENSVRDFKAIQGRYSPEEIANVMDAYNLSATRFNRVLLNISADLLEKNKRKYIVAYPDGYAKQIEADFKRAQDYYANTFQKEMIKLTDGQITGAAFVAMIPQIVNYIKAAIKVVQRIKNELKKMNETLLKAHLIDPYSLTTWDEI